MGIRAREELEFMIFYFMVFAFFILLIFNLLTKTFCLKMQMDAMKQAKNFRVINMIMVALLVCSYLRVLNMAI